MPIGPRSRRRRPRPVYGLRLDRGAEGPAMRPYSWQLIALVLTLGCGGPAAGVPCTRLAASAPAPSLCVSLVCWQGYLHEERSGPGPRDRGETDGETT